MSDHRELLKRIPPSSILEALGEGVYVTNLKRQIVYWNTAAEAITGWTKDDVVGKMCGDGILSHVDKDGHRLCGEEFCPLHRSIVNNVRSALPIIVFARSKSGRRIPVQVSVAPIKDDDGEVIGGVETFRDLTRLMNDLERSMHIQRRALERDLPHDPRLHLGIHYVPSEFVGGDFYAFESLSKDSYAFFQADVMGHGVASALYTMYLRSMWEELRGLLNEPAEFLQAFNNLLHKLLKKDYSFATAVMLRIDLAANEVTWSGSGHPPPLLFKHNGQVRALDCEGVPLGMLSKTSYKKTKTDFEPGDGLLLYTDGAIEVRNEKGRELESDGLATLVSNLGFPGKELSLDHLQECILRYSHDIRIEDDISFLGIRYLPASED